MKNKSKYDIFNLLYHIGGGAIVGAAIALIIIPLFGVSIHLLQPFESVVILLVVSTYAIIYFIGWLGILIYSKEDKTW